MSILFCNNYHMCQFIEISKIKLILQRKTSENSVMSPKLWKHNLRAPKDFSGKIKGSCITDKLTGKRTESKTMRDRKSWETLHHCPVTLLFADICLCQRREQGADWYDWLQTGAEEWGPRAVRYTDMSDKPWATQKQLLPLTYSLYGTADTTLSNITKHNN